jgi:hypothetical protein
VDTIDDLLRRATAFTFFSSSVNLQTASVGFSHESSVNVNAHFIWFQSLVFIKHTAAPQWQSATSLTGRRIKPTFSPCATLELTWHWGHAVSSSGQTPTQCKMAETLVSQILFF